MKTFLNLRLSARLGAAFGFLVLALVATSLVGLSGLSKVNGHAEQLSNRDVTGLQELVTVSEDFLASGYLRPRRRVDDRVRRRDRGRRPADLRRVPARRGRHQRGRRGGRAVLRLGRAGVRSTQETSASTQEIASSAAELARTAEQLDQLVRRFKVTA